MKLQIIDVSNSSSPSLISSVASLSGAYDVAISSDEQFAYVADQVNGLQVIDIGTLSNPALRARSAGLLRVPISITCNPFT